MKRFPSQILLLSTIWRIHASLLPSPGWPTTGCSTTLASILSVEPSWSKCSSVEVTVIETQTILQTSAYITVTVTSVIKSGVVLNTTQTATPSNIKPRNYESSHLGFPSFGFPTTPKVVTASGVWTDCSDSTLTKTITQYTTSTLPAPTVFATVLETQPAYTLSCSEGCKVDATATKLIYPTSVIHVTVPVTVNSLPESHTPEVLTWEYSGVILTYPTTYLFYTEFSHAFLATTESTLATTCPTASKSLTLPGPTNYAPLIYPQQETPGPNLPPSALISYLNAQETVLVQLSGTPIGSSCDPVGGGIVEPVPVTGPAQVLYTSTYILAQTTSSTTSTTVTIVDIIGATSTSTSTSSGISNSVGSTTAAATFASTSTSTVIISSSSSASAVQVVSVAKAPPNFMESITNPLALGLGGFLLNYL